MNVLLITGLLGFIIGLGNLVWIVVHNRRTTFINTVTSERVKWIGRLRENLSKFIGLTHSWLALRNEISSSRVEDIKGQIDILRYEIKLQLNPHAELDNQIIQKIDEIPDLASKPDVTLVHQSISRLVELGQSLLKEEWDKVKREAQRGAVAGTPTLCDRLKPTGVVSYASVGASAIIAGLLLATIGAGLAAKGAVIDKKSATELTSTKWSMNEELRRSLIRQSRDTRNGLMLIAFGSVLQIGGVAIQILQGGKR